MRCARHIPTSARWLKKGWTRAFRECPDSALPDPSASSVILMLFFRELRLGPRSTLANQTNVILFGGGATEIVSPGVV